MNKDPFHKALSILCLLAFALAACAPAATSTTAPVATQPAATEAAATEPAATEPAATEPAATAPAASEPVTLSFLGAQNQNDALMIQALTDNLNPAQIETGISDYVAIGGLFDAGLKQQVEFDMQALQRAAGRTLNEAVQEQFRAIQLQALRWTYLGSAMTHPTFLATVGQFSPGGRKQIEELAPVFS